MDRREFLSWSMQLGLLAAIGVPARAESAHSFTQGRYVSAYGSMAYWFYTPADAAPDLPLILYLHGGSGKGENLFLLLSAESLPKFLQNGQAAPDAYVLMPQLPKNRMGWESTTNLLFELVDSIVSQYGLDPKQVRLTGHSMGGTGVWAIAQAYPERFSAIAPLSGSVTPGPAALENLAALPIWAVVGAKDTIVPPESSERLIDALSKINPDCRCTVLPDADHFAVPQVYLDEELGLLGWLSRRNS